MGKLSDLYGRIRVISSGIVTLLLFVIPYFAYATSGTFIQVLVFHGLIAIPCAAIFAVVPVFITDIFPHSIRCSITNFVYSVAACLGGGITPLIALKLGERQDCSSGCILVVFGTVGLIALFFFIKRNSQKTNQLLLVYSNPI